MTTGARPRRAGAADVRLPRPGPLGLRLKIIAWSFVPTALILLAVALVNFRAYRQVTEDLVIQRDQELVRLSAGRLAADLTEHTEMLASVVRTAEVYESDRMAQRAALARAARRLSAFDGGVLIISTTGTVIACEPERPGVVGRNWSDRPYFRQMLRSPGPVFSDVAPDGPDGSDVIVVAVPIIGYRGEFVGIMAAMFRVDAAGVSSFYANIAGQRLGERGNAYIVDANGRVIYHTDLDQNGADYAGRPLVQEVLHGGLGYVRTEDTEGRPVLANFARVPGTRWSLVTEETWTGLMRPSEPYRLFLLVLLGLGVVVPAFAVSAAAGRITRPVRQLIEAAREVAGGRFGRTIDAPTGDEIEELATQFNLMSAQLRESYANLEQRVADRTRELAALNGIAAAVSASLDLSAVLESALDGTMAVMSLEAGAAYRLDEAGGGLELMAHRGLSPDFVRRVAHLPPGEGTAGLAARSAEPVARRPGDYPEGPLRRAIVAEGLNLVVSVPLQSKGRVLGVINVAGRAARPITPEETALLRGIGQQTGLAMDNARLYERAEEAAAAAERSRLARELHDAVTQTLFSAGLIAEVLPRIWERHPEEGARRLGQLRQLTRGALAEMRTLLLELRPTALTEADLADLLRQLAEATTGRTQIPVELEVRGNGRLPPEVQVAFYRAAQEALNNMAKHSGASRAAVTLVREAESLTLTVSDDGHGFDPAAVTADHMGLGIMRERAEAIGADLRLESAVGQGTSVSVAWRRPPDDGDGDSHVAGA